MEEEEFLKEHPSLKGKIVCTDELYYDSVTKKHRADLDCDLVIPLQDIHKTQIDKQRVEEAMNRLQEIIGKGGINLAICDLIEEKKKELGL